MRLAPPRSLYVPWADMVEKEEPEVNRATMSAIELPITSEAR
jgi:hypothetical protein